MKPDPAEDMDARPRNQDPLPAPEPSLSGLRFSRRRLIWIGGLAIATVVGLLAIGDAPTTFSAIQQAEWRFVGFAVLIHYSGFAVRGHRWQLLLRATGHRLAYVRVTAILIGGWFVSALLPARLGDVFRIAILKVPPRPNQETVPVADSLSSIILERALDICALLLLSVTFGYMALGASLPRWIMTSYGVALAILLVLVVALFAAPGILDWLYHRSERRVWTAALGFARQTFCSLRTLPAHPAIAIAAIGESVYIWLCDALLLWFVLTAAGVRMDLANAGFVALTVDISAAVPLTPGGMGQIEAAYSALLAMLSVEPAAIAASVLLVRLITYWSFLLFSGAVLFASGLGGVFFKQPTAVTPEGVETISTTEPS
ncbi:MAG: YbhN family protein [Caldilineaceae bacterium]